MDTYSEDYKRIKLEAEEWADWEKECYNKNFAISKHAKKLNYSDCYFRKRIMSAQSYDIIREYLEEQIEYLTNHAKHTLESHCYYPARRHIKDKFISLVKERRFYKVALRELNESTNMQYTQ